MKRRLMLAILAAVVSAGCQSMSHAPREKQEKPKVELQRTAPNGEVSRFGP
jgi:hypothetical protein